MMLANGREQALFLGQVPLVGAHRMGQIIDIPEKVSVQHDIDLQKQLLPIGLIGAGGLSFVLGGQLPDSVRWLGTVAGAGLIGGGVYLLIRGKADEKTPLDEGTIPTSGTTGPRPVEVQQPFEPPPVNAFAEIIGEITSPGWWDEIEASGIFSESYKVNVTLYNPSPVAVTFDAELDIEETPFYAPLNNAGEPVTSNQVQTVTLAAGQQRSFIFSQALQTPRMAAYVEVRAKLSKRRSVADAPVRLADQQFIAR